MAVSMAMSISRSTPGEFMPRVGDDDQGEKCEAGASESHSVCIWEWGVDERGKMGVLRF